MYLLHNKNSGLEYHSPNGLEISTAKEIPQNENPKVLTPLHKKGIAASNSNQSLFISVREKIGFHELIIPEYNLSDQAILMILEGWQHVLLEHRIQVLLPKIRLTNGVGIVFYPRYFLTCCCQSIRMKCSFVLCMTALSLLGMGMVTSKLLEILYPHC